jgi:broad specificity phosphatase PhoE
MKWPTELVIVRHGESEYNILRDRKKTDARYQEFVREFEQDYQSPATIRLAHEIKDKYSLSEGDAATQLTENGILMSIETGKRLRGMIGIPHVIFVSPYHRTISTLNAIRTEWSELYDVKTVFEDRIREKEHGLSVVYNDWRVFQVLHPEQKLLHDVQGEYWYQHPQGESISQVRERIRSFLSTLGREYSGQRVMLVTHHLTLLAIRGILERLSPEGFIQLDSNDKPVNCGVTIYEGNPIAGKDGRLELKQYNVKLY